MGKRKPAPLTLQPTPEQLERWKAVAKHLHRDLPDYVAFAADWTYRYLREQIRMRKRSDPVGFRMEEKRRMEAVLRTARESKKFLPVAFETRNGISLDPAGDIDRAIENLEAFWAEYQTEPAGV